MNIPFALSNPFRFKSIAAINHDIDDELEFHIQCRIDELVAAGETVAEAQRQAQAAFGSTDRIRKQCQRINYGIQPWLAMSTLLGVALLVGVIGWLSIQLASMKNQNDLLHEQLMAAATAAAVPMPVQDRHDLFGTAVDSEGNPIADAKVLLIFKSWPNRQYRQQKLATETDSKGEFRFKNLYSTTMQTAFLVTVVADGYTMESKYWVNEDQKKIDTVSMVVSPAVSKSLVLLNEKGIPIANASVFPRSRTAPGSKEDMIYAQSASDVMYKTDENGRLEMHLFKEGDQATIGIRQGQSSKDVEFRVDGNAVQVLGGQTKVAAGDASDSNKSGMRTGKADLTGRVTTDGGKPIAGAMVLLVHKSWPNQRYRQDFFKTKTDNDGKFRFDRRYRLNEQNAFLVSIVADGWAMKSTYLLDRDGIELDPFEFQMEKAMSKSFIFQDENGKPLKRVGVYPSGRQAGDDEFMIYSGSGKDVDVKTDGKGKASFTCFLAGDVATVGLIRGGSVKFEVDDQAEQVVVVKKK